MNSMLPTSSPRVGWSRMSSFSGRSNSRATTSFCWLPPDNVLGRDVGRRRPDVVLGDALVGRLLDRAEVAQDAAGERRPVVARQHDVVGERERQDEPEPVAVGGHVRDAGLVHLARPGRR